MTKTNSSLTTTTYLWLLAHVEVLANITAAGGLDGVKLVNIPTVDGLSERQYYSQINALSQLAR